MQPLKEEKGDKRIGDVDGRTDGSPKIERLKG